MVRCVDVGEWQAIAGHACVSGWRAGIGHGHVTVAMFRGFKKRGGNTTCLRDLHRPSLQHGGNRVQVFLGGLMEWRVVATGTFEFNAHQC